MASSARSAPEGRENPAPWDDARFRLQFEWFLTLPDTFRIRAVDRGLLTIAESFNIPTGAGPRARNQAILDEIRAKGMNSFKLFLDVLSSLDYGDQVASLTPILTLPA